MTPEEREISGREFRAEWTAYQKANRKAREAYNAKMQSRSWAVKPA